MRASEARGIQKTALEKEAQARITKDRAYHKRMTLLTKQLKVSIIPEHLKKIMDGIRNVASIPSCNEYSYSIVKSSIRSPNEEERCVAKCLKKRLETYGYKVKIVDEEYRSEMARTNDPYETILELVISW